MLFADAPNETSQLEGTPLFVCRANVGEALQATLWPPPDAPPAFWLRWRQNAAQEKRQHGKCDYSLPNVRKSHLFCGLLDSGFLRWQIQGGTMQMRMMVSSLCCHPATCEDVRFDFEKLKLVYAPGRKASWAKASWHTDKHTRVFKAMLSQGFFFWLYSENNVSSLKIKPEMSREWPDRGHCEAAWRKMSIKAKDFPNQDEWVILSSGMTNEG